MESSIPRGDTIKGFDKNSIYIMANLLWPQGLLSVCLSNALPSFLLGLSTQIIIMLTANNLCHGKVPVVVKGC